jgi:hypothetical protein
MKKIFVLLCVPLFPIYSLFAADSRNEKTEPQAYEMSLSHGRKISNNTIEFDIYIKSPGKKFVLENYQCAFNLGRNLPSTNLRFDYISNSAEIKNFPSVTTVLIDEGGRTMLVFASHPQGADTIKENNVKVGRFRIRSINADSLFQLKWNFTGDINTIISASAKNITNPVNHLDFNGNASVGNEKLVLPKVYALSQNFPNPFNPNTSIRFALPFESKIKISIYNTIGEFVTNLVDKVEQAGNHSVTWNASNFASGMYIYTIEAEPLKGGNSFKSVKKMMLLK